MRCSRGPGPAPWLCAASLVPLGRAFVALSGIQTPRELPNIVTLHYISLGQSLCLQVRKGSMDSFLRCCVSGIGM